jgi:hypothetical protein
MWHAWINVATNHGAPGVDRVSIDSIAAEPSNWPRTKPCAGERHARFDKAAFDFQPRQPETVSTRRRVAAGGWVSRGQAPMKASQDPL